MQEAESKCAFRRGGIQNEEERSEREPGRTGPFVRRRCECIQERAQGEQANVPDSLAAWKRSHRGSSQIVYYSFSSRSSRWGAPLT